MENEFRNEWGQSAFYNKYAMTQAESWKERSHVLQDDVVGTAGGTKQPLLPEDDRWEVERLIRQFWFMPGGRYIYYAGRPLKAYNNCYLLRAEEDTREEWARLMHDSTSCLMFGGGIGTDYSRLRPSGRMLKRTGGVASGPLPLMDAVNELGRNIMQGGSRRSAIYASLNHQHGDIDEFLKMKNWSPEVEAAKLKDYNARGPLDMTNISVNYDDAWLNDPDRANHEVFKRNVRQALMTGEPGFSFNFGPNQNFTLRNACTEVITDLDSNVCNLGSVNMSRIERISDFRDAVRLGSQFLLCGTLRAVLPYKKVELVREATRLLGLGLMGVHEWLLVRGYRYEVVPELHEWLTVYRDESVRAANELADKLSISRPRSYRAIAPTGTIGILAGTTTGIEPLFRPAYKRRYLVDGTRWKYQYVIDGTAEELIKNGADPDKLETAISLAEDPERRIKFQADVQDYVDMGISSTINLPKWGSKHNNEDNVQNFANMLAKYAPRLRGFTCYPDESRGGQPLTEIPYKEAVKHAGTVFEESPDVCSITGHGGVCGV